jgi:hypothetical protein
MWNNLSTGFALTFFLPVDVRKFRFSWGLFWLSVIANVLLNIIDLMALLTFQSFPIDLFWFGMQADATYLFLLFLIAYVVSRSFHTPLLQVQIPVLFLYAELWLNGIYILLTQLLYENDTEVLSASPSETTLFSVFVVWQTVICFRVLYHLTPYRPQLQVANAALISAAITVPFLYLDNWSPSQEDIPWESMVPEIVSTEVDAEAILFQQAQHIDQSIAALEPSKPDEANVYFVVFAGDATQNVFRKEALFSRHVMETRFNVGKRSLLLVNNVETLDQFPLATPTNLQYALERLNDHINPEQDLLFLFVTSHGVRQSLAVDFPGLPLNQLNSERLKQALSKSHFQNKVMVLSACYSGSFVDSLKDEHSLIITAASSDRPSFGCSDTADLTYFGRAFFANALPNSGTFIEAFEQAKTLVTQWETKEDYQPSEPQLFVGEKIAEVLPTIEAGFFPPPEQRGSISPTVDHPHHHH